MICTTKPFLWQQIEKETIVVKRTQIRKKKKKMKKKEKHSAKKSIEVTEFCTLVTLSVRPSVVCVHVQCPCVCVQCLSAAYVICVCVYDAFTSIPDHPCVHMCVCMNIEH